MGLAYDWIKIGHLFSVIAWMAGIFYLPRLFVYHADAVIGSVQSETFKVMERRLFRGIMRPAMYGTWGFGLWLGLKGGWFSGVSWLWLKGLLVLALTVYHYQLDAWRKAFELDANRHNSRFFRMMNELPTVLLLGILVLVVLKPL
ncbi:protoporphyrinogen oxidase HemJ [Pleomorphomonas sp. JP5]|uniref:protoporphyrinogen oxidase HemJ n=1 Tax=Pleomorphomonas sp. JP5 TaxID=2942998 RepID=UPI0020433BB7|nr:protoporphyrinogen oxidase HemJ [Pleomorphomonas sp. JP5]MCM5559745.1 protoporphyrinogen oxidase HemJ [Pleomorphomonas sp. JP5]